MARYLPDILIVSFAFVAILTFSVFDWIRNATPTTDNSSVLAAAVALVGTNITVISTTVGLLIKHSIDQRNLELKQQAEKRLQIDQDHNHKLARDAAGRLKLETALGAIRLLATDAGTPALPETKAGALFVLAQLDNIELALMLTHDFLAKDKLAGASASLVFRAAFDSGSPELQTEAAYLMRQHAKSLANPPKAIYWPTERWEPDFPDSAKRHLIKAAAAVTIKLVERRGTLGQVLAMVMLFADARTDACAEVAVAAQRYLAELEPIVINAGSLVTAEGYVPIGELTTPTDPSFEGLAAADGDLAEKLREAVVARVSRVAE